MVQVNPHRHGKTGTQVKATASKLLQIGSEFGAALLTGDIKGNELNVLGEWVRVLSPYD